MGMENHGELEHAFRPLPSAGEDVDYFAPALLRQGVGHHRQRRCNAPIHFALENLANTRREVVPQYAGAAEVGPGGTPARSPRIRAKFQQGENRVHLVVLRCVPQGCHPAGATSVDIGAGGCQNTQGGSTASPCRCHENCPILFPESIPSINDVHVDVRASLYQGLHSLGVPQRQRQSGD